MCHKVANAPFPGHFEWRGSLSREVNLHAHLTVQGASAGDLKRDDSGGRFG
jgi:hypothetical protein